MQDDAIGLERREDLSGYVLVVEGDDVALPGESAHRLDVGVVAHGRGGDDQGRRRVR